MNGILKIASEIFVPFVGVGGFDKIVDEPKKEGAVAGAHQFLCGGRLGFTEVVGLTAVGVNFFALTGTE